MGQSLDQKSSTELRKKTKREAHSNLNPPEFEAEKIVAARVTRSGVKQYYVRWIGFAPRHNSWEAEENLAHAQDILHVGDFLSIVPDPHTACNNCWLLRELLAASLILGNKRFTPPSLTLHHR